VRRLLVTTASLLWLLPTQAATRSFESVVQQYIAQALDSNLGLQGQDLQVERSAAALDAAKARFWPELSLTARYSLAQGGRTLDFPIGQLINPAYQTLNQLLVAQGQPARFGTLPDQSIAFQREHEQDTRISLRQPLYQPAIPAAVAAQRELLSSEQYARVALARQLLRDVTIGYAGWLMALSNEQIVRSSSQLLDENLRVVNSLHANGRITQDQVLRAQAEQLAVQQQLGAVRGAVAQARSYLNFLMNRPLDTPLEQADAANAPDSTSKPELQLRDTALQNRAELAQLDALGKAADAQLRIARAALAPQLALGVDAGTQGEQYRLGSGYNFVSASLVLTWKFFDGGASRAAADEARIAGRRTAVARQATAQRVALEVQQAIDALAVARDALTTAAARQQAADAALRIAGLKRDEGSISQVEFLDARTAATAAHQGLNTTRFELLQRTAELDYATGSGELPMLRTTAKDLLP